jgi:hypothetical protein
LRADNFGGREGARTPDLLVANDKLAVQDVHKVLSVQQNAFGSRKLLKAFSLAGWTLRWTLDQSSKRTAGAAGGRFRSIRKRRRNFSQQRTRRRFA